MLKKTKVNDAKIILDQEKNLSEELKLIEKQHETISRLSGVQIELKSKVETLEDYICDLNMQKNSLNVNKEMLKKIKLKRQKSLRLHLKNS